MAATITSAAGAARTRFTHGYADDDRLLAACDSSIDQLFADRGHDAAAADNDDVLHGTEAVPV